jgi:hypothetical protein
MSVAIEKAIKKNDWKGARRLIQKSLRSEPDSHWLLTRLGLTYYEEGDYERALAFESRAYEIMPQCPLVLWDMAGTLEMLGRYAEAVAFYRQLVKRGVKRVAYGDCGEGLKWAQSLICDCWYRLGKCAIKLGRKAEAIRSFEKHFEMRGPACRSIYPIKDVRKEFNDCIFEAQRKELDRRLEDYRRNPRGGSSWKTVKQRILGRNNRHLR